MIQRAPSLHVEHASSAENKQNMEAAIHAVEHSPSINRRANYYVLKDLYKQKGVDLDEEFKKRSVTAKRENTYQEFLHNKHHGPASELAETLPLYANAPGRLGDYIEASVTKTARPDDQGNSFIDFVVEVKNNWLGSKFSPPQAKDLPAKMTFLVDVTTAWGDMLEKKRHALQAEFLVRGKEANVLCYQNSLGELGVKRPKILVAKTAEYMERMGARIGSNITQRAADSFSINNPAKFDEVYREYFLNFMQAIKEGAQENIRYLERLEHDTNRRVLMDKYKKIIAFVDMYEKTPTKRAPGA